jgi:hypothetical protein
MQKITTEFYNLITRGLGIRNPNGSFPAGNSVLAVSGPSGNLQPTRDVNLNSVTAAYVTTDDLTATNINVSGTQTVKDVNVTGNLTAASVTTDDLTATNISVSGTPTFKDVNVTGNLTAASVTTDELTAKNISVSGTQTVSDVNVTGKLTAAEANLAGTLITDEGITSKQAIVGFVEAETVHVSFDFIANGAAIKGTVVADRAEIKENLSTATAIVSGTLTTGDTNVLNILNTADMNVSKTLNANNTNVIGTLNAVDTNVTGTLNVTGSSTTNDITASGDIIANNNNIYAYGDGNMTGSVQSEYQTLMDLNSANRHETYLWAQNNDLFWQNGPDTANKSLTGWGPLLAPEAHIVIPDATNQTDINEAVVRVITTLINRGIILTSVEAQTAKTITFSSPCKISFNVRAISSPDIIESYVVSREISTPGLDVLCTELTSTSSYIKFDYAQSTQYVVIRVAPGYTYTIDDIDEYGQAVRFLNHIGVQNQMNVCYGGLTPAYSFSITGFSLLTYPPNTDSPVAAPTIADAYVGPAPRDPTSLTITIMAAPAPVPPLTSPNEVKYYGIYLNGVNYDLIPATSSSYTFLNLTPATSYTISASSIDLYNETLVGVRSSVVISSGPLVVPWPPAGYVSKILQTARTATPTPAGPYTDIPNPGASGSLVPYRRDTTFYQSFRFNIIPKSTLTDICLQINSDDGFKITFTGLQPTSSVSSPPDPLLNLTGTNLSPATGGQYQYSQPITLTENQIYPVQIDYYNLQNLRTGESTPSIFAITYVTPTAASPWSLGWKNTCPTLDVLPLQNLMQFCFIPTS